ncbi:MAG: ABC transporter permease [Candidatus Pacebacteria bacterium]|nr:ABC transporter permease [Candidatus Paceibacterota bacterium]
MENFKGLFKIALKNLKTRKLRSWLTIIGIAIGIFLVVTLFSLSQGIKEAVSSQLKSLGDEIITIMPGDEENMFLSMMGGVKLNKDDIEAIKNAEGVDKVFPYNYTAVTGRYLGEAKQVLLFSLDLKDGLDVLKGYQGFEVSSGNWPRPGRREIVIGSYIASKQFSTAVQIGDIISLDGRKVEVCGILKSLGNKNDDSMVMIEESIFREMTGIDTNSGSQVMAKIEEGADPAKVAKNIEESLSNVRQRKRGTDKKDFMVLTADKMGDIAGNVLGTLQFAVIGFASIAIIVGGIGIANTMFTSVRERIREIGIMKAIGAKDSSINYIFLLESGTIGLIGGAGGTLLGILFAKIIEWYFTINPVIALKAYISFPIILFSLLFSFLLGCLFGYLPARSAAKLKPADSLRRYE